MKIAKKVLAVVMALAMVAALSVMAFADGKVYLTDEGVADGTLTMYLYVDDAEGFQSAGILVKYDPKVLEFNKAKNGVDAKAASEDDNTYSGLANKTADGEVKYAFNLLESITADNEGVNAKHFQAAVFTFTVKDANAANTTVAIELQNNSGTKVVAGDAVNVVLKEAPAEEPSSAEEKPTDAEKPADDGKEEATTAPVNPNSGDKKTGDNMALAAAGAVVALAGVAFVISKKRK